MSEILCLLKEFCENSEDCRFYENYSGRGMYGRKCVGFVCEDNVFQHIIRLADFLHESAVSSAEEALGQIQMDQLGFERIVYFPELSHLC